MFGNWLNILLIGYILNPYFHRTLLIIKNNNSSQKKIHHFVGGFLPNLIRKLLFTKLLLVREININQANFLATPAHNLCI